MPNGKPMATTSSPGIRSAVERMVAATRSSGIFCARSTARSFSGCTLTMAAGDSVPSAKVTVMDSASCTTCKLVRMVPLSMITTPVPTPRPISAGPLRPFRPGMSPSTRTSEGPTAAAARAACEGRVFWVSVCITAALMSSCVSLRCAGARQGVPGKASARASAAMAAHNVPG